MSLPNVVSEVQYVGALTLQVTIAVAMYWKRLYTGAKFFFAYILWQTFSVAAIYAIGHTRAPIYYFYAYWINDAVDVVFGMTIVVETFRHIFAPYKGILRVARICLTVAAVLLCSASIAFLFYRHAQYSNPVLTFVLVMERSVRVVQLGLILSLFGITRYLHLRWKNYQFGIALGFGFYALVTLAVLVITLTSGKPMTATINLLWGTGYCAAVLIWMFYVLQPEAKKIPIVSLPSHHLQHWDEALSRLLGRKPSSSTSAAAG